MENNNSNETRYRVLNAKGEEKAKEISSSIAEYNPMEAITFTLSSQLLHQGTIQYSPNSKHTKHGLDTSPKGKKAIDYSDYINHKDWEKRKMVTSHSTIGSYA